jgi:16S rRNA (uracil1498-N3)-methyltransferase
LPAEVAPAWLYVPGLPEAGGSLALSSDDTHYLVRVCRAQEGDVARATDGRGGVALLRLLRVRPDAVARVESIDRATRAGAARLLCGAPEGERADWLIEKLAELGVATFQPVDCERSRWEKADRRMERWGRLAIAALRQSRGRHRMEILPPRELREVLRAPLTEGQRWLAESDGKQLASELGPPAATRIGAVGPAEGFSPEEREALRVAGFEPVSLGERRLRTETAALALATCWSVAG